MRAYGVVVTAWFVTVAACGRSPLGKPANRNQGGHGAGGIAGTLSGTGGHTQTTPTGSGGTFFGEGGTATAGSGGTQATGGRVTTGGTRATGGISGLGGLVGTGGFIRSGGAMATGGTIGTGGRSGSGGAMSSGGAPPSGGTTGTGGATGTGGSCGNGTIGPVEQCDLGAGNKTLPAFSVTQAGQGFAGEPLVGSVSSPYFYAYSSVSAHTGFEALGTSRILLYVDKTTLDLSLAVFHGVDKDSTGLEQPTSRVVMWFSGLPDTTTVGESDDPDELIMTAANTALGDWKFTNNSDGGLLHRLPFPGDWEITIQPTFVEGISTWTWVQGDGSFVNLDLTQPIIIKANRAPGACRSDCTSPRCGDGFLDGGEVCDDGSQPRTGCLGDCMSFDF